MVEENTEEPRIEDGRGGIALCWWKRRALRRGHGSWYSSVGVGPALRVSVQPLEAFKKSVEFLQLSSRPNRSTCTDLLAQNHLQAALLKIAKRWKRPKHPPLFCWKLNVE